MIDDTLLQEYGLLGSFDTIVNMSGEQIAIKLQPVEDIDDNDSMDDSFSSISYIELQDNSTLLSNQVKMRFGVKSGDRILIVTSGNTGAEITAMLATIRLGATLVPISIPKELAISDRRVQSIISLVAPTAAILVAADDNDPIVHYLAKLGVYKCALLTPRGILSADDPSSCVVVTLPSPSDDAILPPRDLPLYILFTSGSTGEPKGVQGTYCGLINRIAWQYRYYPYEFGEVAIRRTPLTFVDSLAEIFAPLLAGIPIVDYFMSSIQTVGLASVVEDVSAAEVSRITLIPSQLLQTCRLLHSTTTTSQSNFWPSLQYVIVSGEECPVSLVKLFRVVFPHARLLNLYGSTEVAGDVTAALLYDGHATAFSADKSDIVDVQAEEQEQERAAIGTAIDGNFLFLVQPSSDSNSVQTLQLITDHIQPGELMVLGEHVALGYLKQTTNDYDNDYINSSKSTQFIANPFLTNPLLLPAGYDEMQRQKILSYSTAFLTGDIVQWSDQNPQSSLLWLGRRDRVVKIRGNKVSLEEIERSANAILGMNQVVVVLSLPHHTITDNKNADQQRQVLVMIIDYAQLQQLSRQENRSEVRQRLMQGLPEIQRPHIMLFLEDGFPHTSSMKIDSVALKQQVLTLLDTQSSSPSQAASVDVANAKEVEDAVVEETFSKIVSFLHDILPHLHTMKTNEMKQIDFFSLGGDSISAIELLWRLRQSYPTVIIQQHTLRLRLLQLATYIANPSSANSNSSREVQVQDAHPSKKIRKEQSASQLPNISHGAFHTITRRGGFVHGNNSLSNSSSPAAVLKLLWRYPLLKCIDASPVVCTGPGLSLAIIGCHGGRVAAIDTSTGSMVWKVDIIEHIEAAVTIDLVNGLVFVVSYLGNDIDGFTTFSSVEANGMLGAIRCLSLYTGAVIWMQRLRGECKASPVLLSTAHVLLVADYAGCLYKFSTADGRLLGRTEDLLPGSIFATPIVFDQERRALVCTTRGWIVLVRLHDMAGYSLTATESTIFANPCILSDSPQNPLTCIVAFTDGSIRCYRWKPQLDCLFDIWRTNASAAPFFSSPTITPARQQGEVKRIVIGCHDGFLRCLDTQTGVVITALNLGTVIFGTPFLILSTQHDLVAVATTAGDVVIANVSEGLVVSTFQLPAEVFSSPAMDDQGRLLIGCRDDHVYSLQLSS